MCIHETIQLSQDGEKTIVCGDCGREFGRIGWDEGETLIAFVDPNKTVVVIPGPDADYGVAMTLTNGVFKPQPVYPCAKCGWAMSCKTVDGEECHT